MTTAEDRQQQNAMVAGVSELIKANHDTQAVMRNMSGQIASVVQAVSNLTDATKSLKTDLDGVKKTQSDSGKTQWGIVIAAAVALFGGMQWFGNQFLTTVQQQVTQEVSAISQRFEKVDDDILRIYAEFKQHAGEEGHPYSVIAKIAALDDRVSAQIRNQKEDTERIQKELDRMRSELGDVRSTVDRRTGIQFRDGKPYTLE